MQGYAFFIVCNICNKTNVEFGFFSPQHRVFIIKVRYNDIELFFERTSNISASRIHHFQKDDEDDHRTLTMAQSDHCNQSYQLCTHLRASI